MDNSRIVFLINDSVRAVLATYEDKAPPEMFKTFDPTIKAYDLVVVETGTRHGMTVVKVVEVDVDVNFDSSVPLKWIAQKIDKIAFDSIKEHEGAAITAVQAAELKRKKAELRATMVAGHEETIAALALTNIPAAE